MRPGRTARPVAAQTLADGLDRRWPQLAEAYADGSVSTPQVQVIGKALDDLPPDLDDTIRAGRRRTW